MGFFGVVIDTRHETGHIYGKYTSVRVEIGGFRE